jgi:hypothetical protein
MADIRASDDERERTVETLRRHATAGRLDAGELDERLGLALAAKTRAELVRLTEDLPAERRPQPQVTPPSGRAGCRRHGHGHDPRRLAAWSLMMVAIWALTGAGYFWPMWPLLAFAIVGWAQWRRGNRWVIGNRSHTGNAVGTGNAGHTQ